MIWDLMQAFLSAPLVIAMLLLAVYAWFEMIVYQDFLDRHSLIGCIISAIAALLCLVMLVLLNRG